jgi:hypothetical protein
MIFSEGVDVVAIAEVVLTGYMLQTVMRAVITAVVAIIAILRIVLSSQEVVLCWSCLIFAGARRSFARSNAAGISGKALSRCSLGNRSEL